MDGYPTDDGYEFHDRLVLVLHCSGRLAGRRARMFNSMCDGFRVGSRGARGAALPFPGLRLEAYTTRYPLEAPIPREFRHG